MITIKLAGVPEHFNLPWHLGIEDGSFTKNNINLEWIDYHGGTGAMCKALRDKDVDMAIILTEGIVKDITEGNPSKIVQTYIETPLIWGIHVDAKSNFKDLSELKNTTAAISRFGSGSHLMAHVNAQNQQWSNSNLTFTEVQNLDGAVEALTNDMADYFMWEHFTTKPLVDDGTFRRIDDCPSPWPCFVIAVRDEVLKNNPKEVKDILTTINTITSDFKHIPSIDKSLSIRYEQRIEDIQEWLSKTEWSQTTPDKKTIENVQNQLLNLGLIDKKITLENLVYEH